MLADEGRLESPLRAVELAVDHLKRDHTGGFFYRHGLVGVLGMQLGVVSEVGVSHGNSDDTSNRS